MVEESVIIENKTVENLLPIHACPVQCTSCQRSVFNRGGPTADLSQTDRAQARLSPQLERHAHEERNQTHGQQLKELTARQGLVCSDSGFFFLNQNKANQKPSSRLSPVVA